jgi:hypothetical protein
MMALIRLQLLKQGFGSSNAGALGDANIQTYLRIE